MDYFGYKKNVLFAEDADINALVKKYGTPLFIYSRRTFIEHFHKIRAAFTGMDPLICYSVKANPSLSILSELCKEGAGFDIVSGGELFRVLKAGADPKKIVYAGVGKTVEEIQYGIKSGILMFNVESVNELKQINAVARAMKRTVDVGLRINPDVEADTHHYITTGKKENKFGIDIKLARTLFTQAKKYAHVRIVGIDMHIGSQITAVEPYIQAVGKVRKLIEDMNASGASIEFFDIGGGLGIIYNEEAPQTADKFAASIMPLLKGLEVKVILEPGRFIIGNAGILVAKVIYNKKGGTKNFLITDAGMNDLIRPCLYQAYHKIIPVNVKKAKLALYDVVGPICESSDFMGKDRHLPVVQEGDLIAVRSAGAYGMSMASNYNSRRRAAEVMVKGSRSYLIRERETMEDLIEKEKIVKII
jgi:diaminopimelate decarboxylase